MRSYLRWDYSIHRVKSLHDGIWCNQEYVKQTWCMGRGGGVYAQTWILGAKTILNRPSAKTVNCLLTIPLLSNIKFNKKLSKRTCHGPVEYKSCLYRTEWTHYIIDRVRLIDNILIICKGNERSLTTFKFIEHPNGAEPSFKFAWNLLIYLKLSRH